MLVYRIVYKKYSHSLVAPGIAGRWNSAGKKVIYAAQSISLAFMESMIRRAGFGFNNQYNTMVLEIPDKMVVTTVAANSLRKGWRDYRDYSICQQIGDKWYKDAKTAILKVPSAVLPQENNYVINTMHKDFLKVRQVATIPVVPDERIEEILKKYKLK
jgi:RES domain-containing protein